MDTRVDEVIYIIEREPFLYNSDLSYIQQTYQLHFGECQMIEEAVMDYSDGRYWKHAYNYPSVGDIIQIPIDHEQKMYKSHIVVSVGLFTFNAEDCEESDEEPIDLFDLEKN